MSATVSTVAVPLLLLAPTADFTSLLITFSLGHNRPYPIVLNVVISNFTEQLVTKLVWKAVVKWTPPAIFSYRYFATGIWE
jgi:hypothetical protein